MIAQAESHIKELEKKVQKARATHEMVSNSDSEEFRSSSAELNIAMAELKGAKDVMEMVYFRRV